MEKQLADMVQGFMFSFGGSTNMVEELYAPLEEEIAASLTAAGLEEALKNPRRIPTDPPPRKAPVKADMFSTPFFIGIAVFMATTLGSWAVTKLTDEVYDAKIRPALLKLAGRYRNDYEAKGYAYSVEFEFRVYYDTDELEVTIKARADSAKEIEALAALIPEAEKRALAWVKENGIKGDKMTYYIKNGELSNYPKLG